MPSYHDVNIQIETNKEFVSLEKDPSEFEITSIKHTSCVANDIIKLQKSMNVQVTNLMKKAIIIHSCQALASMTCINKPKLNVVQQVERTP